MHDRDRRRPDVTTVEVVGGQPPLTVGLQEHDPGWAEAYAAHRRRILDAVGDAALAVEHIGSTSVPGLAAKPIVDVVLVVADITAEEDHVAPLVAAGYELRVREPGHRLVRTPARDVHVHVYEEGDPAVEAYLLLRDRLRFDAADREPLRAHEAGADDPAVGVDGRLRGREDRGDPGPPRPGAGGARGARDLRVAAPAGSGQGNGHASCACGTATTCTSSS
ncbi:GrpB family protein [Clavibacter tessellarius]|uniref:GrpB family protein n=1 Tax=Clavibacter tessellarius TaxID=31965 RepID=UPI0032514B0A